jgi:hypothetical protein
MPVGMAARPAEGGACEVLHECLGEGVLGVEVEVVAAGE